MIPKPLLFQNDTPTWREFTVPDHFYWNFTLYNIDTCTHTLNTLWMLTGHPNVFISSQTFKKSRAWLKFFSFEIKWKIFCWPGRDHLIFFVGCLWGLKTHKKSISKNCSDWDVNLICHYLGAWRWKVLIEHINHYSLSLQWDCSVIF